MSIIYTLKHLEALAAHKIGSPRNKKIGLVYDDIAAELSEIAQRSRPWGGGYVRGIVLRSLGASPEITNAIKALKRKKDREAAKKAGMRRMYLEMRCSPDELKQMQKKSLRARALIQLGLEATK